MRVCSPINWSAVKSHGILLLALSSATGAANFVLRPQHKTQILELERKASIQGAKKTELLWSRCPYTNVVSNTLGLTIASRFDYSRLELDAEQVLKLRRRIEGVVKYIEDDSLEQYMFIRTNELRYVFNCNEALLKSLKASGPVSTTLVSSDPQKVTTLFWSLTHRASRGIKSFRLGSVCLESVAGCVATNDTPWSLLKGKVGKGITLAVEAPNPGFSYSQEISNPARYSQVGSNIFFHFSFLVKLENSTNAGPIYLSLAWLPDQRQWAPSRLIVDSWLDLRTIF